MFWTGRFLVLIISSLIIASCTGPTSIVTPDSSINLRANESKKQRIPTTTPILPQIHTQYIVPKYSINIQEEGAALYFENGSPIPAIATFYKNQYLAQKCKLHSESGSGMDAIVMEFSNCESVDLLRIIIYANPNNSGSVITIAPVD